MKPIIISYDCTDHDPIEEWVPDDVFDIDFWMNFTIGPDNKGGDNFQVHVVTPNNLHGKKLRETCNRSKMSMLGRPFLQPFKTCLSKAKV